MRDTDPTPTELLHGEARLRRLLTEYPNTFNESNAHRMAPILGLRGERALEIYRELNPNHNHNPNP